MCPSHGQSADYISWQSPFSRDCPQRPFECMISTLRKLPWYKTECITIKQRHSVYSACIQLIRLLQHAIKEQKNEEHLTPQLLKRLWTSAMLCHGFTVTMRDNIAYQVDTPEDRLREFNMPRFANMWLHAYTLCPKPGTPLDVLEVCILPSRQPRSRVAALLTWSCTVLHRPHSRGDQPHGRPSTAQHSVSDPQRGKADEPVLGLLLQGAEPPSRTGLRQHDAGGDGGAGVPRPDQHPHARSCLRFLSRGGRIFEGVIHTLVDYRWTGPRRTC